MSKWTADDIPDQTGRRIVITGANAGLGLESAKQLARRGGEVVLACRNPAKGEAALAEVRAAATGAAPSLVALDLADLDSVEAAASEISERFSSIDVLMNNAGVMAIPHRETTPQGNEMQFGVNHLGHFALALRLLPTLLKTTAPRVVALGSIVHLGGKIHLDDLNAERSRYVSWTAYSQSKLACMLFAFELDRRAKAAGLPLRGIAAHPGYSSTNLQSSGPLAGGFHPINWVMAKATPLVAQPARIGALGQLRAATDLSLSGGEYLGGTVLFGARGYPKDAYTTPRARSESMAAKLWDASEELTGLRFADAFATTS
ncbi:MAG: SDR family NAD(P)-dependent oxidoreductase [Solirubrobacteraceae bacterium]|nr:SDR family NAD(P)-dependent oxidoreductase [Solirubrobacteraceae bacterium]